MLDYVILDIYYLLSKYQISNISRQNDFDIVTQDFKSEKDKYLAI